jgi:hypothetical protein
MTSARPSPPPHDVPTWRLHALRAMYALVVVGLATLVWPQFFHRTQPWPLAGGVKSCMLVAFSLLSLVGLRYPLQMLPILLWELAWKTIWLLAIAAPLWWSGGMDEGTLGTAIECSLVVLVALAIPWGFVLDHYVRKQGDRWSIAR